MSCTVTPKAVLKKGCWSQSQTTKLIFSQNKIKLKEPLPDGGEIENDITALDTIDGLLQDGTALLLEVVPTEDNSTGVITGDVGNNQIFLGQGEGRQTFHVKTGAPYIEALETFKAFKYGYMYAIQEDNSIRGLQVIEGGSATGDVVPLALNEVTPMAPKFINDGQNVNSILLGITYDAAQTFNTVDYGLQYSQSALEQRYGVDVSDLTVVISGDPFVVTDTTDELFVSGYSGVSGDGYLTVETVDGTTIVEYETPYTVVGSVINITQPGDYAGENVRITIDKDAIFWNQTFYGAELLGTP